MYGSKIASIRLARGYTQEYLAQKLGIDQSAYSRIEKDEKTKIDDGILHKIADVLGVSVEDIKSPVPIIMNFNNSHSFSGQVNGHSSISNIESGLIESLQQQLKQKDEQIAQKDEQIERLLKLLEKK